MDALRKIVIILLLIILMTAVLYMCFAFVLWNMEWVFGTGDNDILTRILFGILWFLLLATIIGLYDAL